MRNIRKYVRRLLREYYEDGRYIDLDTSVHPKLDSLIEKFLHHPDKLIIVVDYNPKFAGIYGTDILIELHNSKESTKNKFGHSRLDDSSKKGEIRINPYDSSQCVLWPNVITGYSEMDDEYNLGPLLYDVAIELSGDSGLMADRRSVSDEAFEVWLKYLNLRDDVKFEQLDDEDLQWTDNEDDDCDIAISRHRYESESGIPEDYWDEDNYEEYEKWARYSYKDPLSKVFYKNNTDVIDTLKAYKRIVIRK